MTFPWFVYLSILYLPPPFPLNQDFLISLIYYFTADVCTNKICSHFGRKVPLESEQRSNTYFETSFPMMFSSHLCFTTFLSPLHRALSKAFNYNVSFFVCFWYLFWLTGDTASVTVWFKNTRKSCMFSPICSFAFILALSCSARTRSFSAVFVCSRRWQGELARWADGELPAKQHLLLSPQEPWTSFPVCSESNSTTDKVALVREESWCISHPEVAGHSGSCPAPKCACALLLHVQEGSLLGLVLGQLFSPADT